MKTERRILLLLVIGAVLLLFGMPAVLSYYDSRTEHAAMRMIERELPSRASVDEMDAFMGRNTERFALDWDYGPKFVGFVPQTQLDRVLFDRQVQIILHVNRGSRTFKRADVQIYYTFL